MADAAGFDEVYRRWQASDAQEALLGAGYPPSVQPFSFVPFDGLARLATELRISAGARLVDLGCGEGGPGLWLAQRCGAGLVGVDSSPVAIRAARRRCASFPEVTGARFEVADAGATGLPDGCADALVSIDVLQLVEAPATMLREAVRLLGPGARMVLTTWEGRDGAPRRFPRDIPGLLRDAGAELDAITEHPGWLRRQHEIYQRAATIGHDPLNPSPAVRALAEEGRHASSWRHAVRRVMVTAVRP